MYFVIRKSKSQDGNDKSNKILKFSEISFCNDFKLYKTKTFLHSEITCELTVKRKPLIFIPK